MKILFFGDIIGRIGRRAVAQILPKYKKKYSPDVVIANGENLAHGIGVTMNTVEEMFEVGVDVLTSGNHIYKKGDYKEVFTNYNNKIIRPANYPEGVDGNGFVTKKVGNNRLVVINLNGRVFFQEDFDDPFCEFDEVYKEAKVQEDDIVFVDFHAEATSEKMAMAWYIDGRADVLFGTHTHVPTADTRIFPKGLAYVTDVGMVGARDSVIGVEKEGPLEMFRTQISQKFERPEEGVAQVNAVLVEIKSNKSKRKIERLDENIEI